MLRTAEKTIETPEVLTVKGTQTSESIVEKAVGIPQLRTAETIDEIPEIQTVPSTQVHQTLILYESVILEFEKERSAREILSSIQAAAETRTGTRTGGTRTGTGMENWRDGRTVDTQSRRRMRRRMR